MIEPVSAPEWPTKQVNAASRQAAEKVIREARQTNTKIVVWKDGKVCHLTADEAERDFRERSVNTPE